MSVFWVECTCATELELRGSGSVAEFRTIEFRALIVQIYILKFSRDTKEL